MAGSSKKVYEVFVSKIPWTLASSKHVKNLKNGIKVTVGSVLLGRELLWALATCATFTSTSFSLPLQQCSFEEMKDYFGQFGQVKKCLVPFDKETGFHRGFCWIGYTSEEGLNNALQKDPHVLEGSTLQVQRNRKVFLGQKTNKEVVETS
uniref:RRM domain-containing protein n=1 Tax=Oncorhynchus tshawytscha TaxID=74940 RepID=A0AAZ3S099_ONCTS